jgi:replicative DNA helicase
MFDTKSLSHKDWIYSGNASLEIEEVVLATLVNFPNNIYIHGNELNLFLFSFAHTKYIYEKIVSTAKEGKVDLIIIADKTKSVAFNYDGKTQPCDDILHDICDRVNSDVHLLEHVKILGIYARRRQLYDLSEYINKEVLFTDASPDEVIKQVNIKLSNINSLTNDIEFSVTQSLMDVMESIASQDDKDVMFSYNYELDKFIYGFEPGNLIVIAAAPSMGKTAFALHLFANQIKHNVPVAFFSLEMSKKELLLRLIASESDVYLSSIRRKTTSENDWNRMNVLVENISKKNWYIDDNSLEVNKIINKIRKLHYQKGIKMFFVDYLQLCWVSLGKGALREQEIAYISRSLKLVAKELGIIIIALSQINRSVNKRDDKRPALSDLRESGAIEQDADMVIFLYREEYYNVNRELPYMEDIELIIGKGRATGVGTVKTHFIASLTKFPTSDEAYKVRQIESPDKQIESKYQLAQSIYDETTKTETEILSTKQSKTYYSDPTQGHIDNF